MNPDLIGKKGWWLFTPPHALGYLVRIPVTVIGSGYGRVKVRVCHADGSECTRFVPESQLRLRTRPGRKSRAQRCPYEGCPASYITVEGLDRHVGTPHTRCACGRYFTADGLVKHLGQCRRRGIQHP